MADEEKKDKLKIIALHIPASAGGIGIQRNSQLRAKEDRATFRQTPLGVEVEIRPPVPLERRPVVHRYFVPWAGIKYLEYGPVEE